MQDRAEIEKKELELKAHQYLEMLEEGVKSFGKDVKKTGTTTLIIGGVFLAAFILGRKFFGDKKNKKSNGSSLNQVIVKNVKSESPIARMIKEHIAIFLITLIKEKLITYLSELEKNKHESVR